MNFLKPADGPDVVYEFFAPFAHVEGRYEWCRIRGPTHGVFDCFIALSFSPVVVYVNSEDGSRFMAERYPEARAVRVRAEQLRLTESSDGRQVRGELDATEGPLRQVRLVFAARPSGPPRNVAYGGEGKPVWGSGSWTCWGVDLVLDAFVDGFVESAGGREEFRAARGLLTLGSFGRIAPLPKLAPPTR